ncbi:class C beta-lactamase [Photobacterium galatheae]|uniref:Beta-lactamase n=1 Tax=Photobacterium galatheae TaxID=1654360 RepID=A0A066RS80_9GAMM|nr:class C beta-lactamase [Photobacterium galatheae]KDM93169.1 beta-lactamase/D-alanine carboxypeptidase [Photobacterium galatheae]MCM0148302.1 beta-lactamase [Photobacterium galatheae]
MKNLVCHSKKLIISVLYLASVAAPLASAAAPVHSQTTKNDATLKLAVDQQAKQLMETYNIPGMAFGITINGKAHYYNYGLADIQRHQPVTENTLFELGSVSKTLAATLASYAQQQGKLSFDDQVSKYLPELKGSTIGNTQLIRLATYTAGGLPLQFPENVTDHATMLDYYRHWQPVFPAGTRRQYSNPSIGLFGYLAARSMGSEYPSLMENRILPELGMSNTFVNVPETKMRNYAFGYNAAGDAVRVNPGVLDTEAYGIKSTSADMVRYIEANVGTASVQPVMKQALANTKTGYYQSGALTQGLGWEMYAYPVTLDTLLDGNANQMILNPMPIKANASPKPLSEHIWVNKTGSTGGFGAYVAYIPAQKTGLVILANKSYPNADRIKAAYAILKAAEK